MPHRTVKQARLVLQHFIAEACDGQRPKAINTEKFIKFIARKFGWTLKVEVVSMIALRGLLLRKETGREALMLISDANTSCWKRFTAVKESCHLFIQLEEQINCDNALEMAEALVLQTSFMPELLPPNNGDTSIADIQMQCGDDLIKQIAEVASASGLSDRVKVPVLDNNSHGLAESAAIVAAIEVMLPENHRSLIKEMAETDTLYQIANEFKVPKLILEYRLKGWGVSARVSSAQS